MTEKDPFDPDVWLDLGLAERRDHLVAALRTRLSNHAEIVAIAVELGPIGREYDLTVLAETDAGRLRTPLWSHGRATIFADPSIHSANRRQLSPALAVAEAADRLERRLSVPYRLESRGLTFTLSPEDGVERTWTAEHSLFRKRTAVVREDRVERAGEVDVRDLLAHFYTGPSLRLVADDGEAFLLPAAVDAEGPLATLCHECRRWNEGAWSECPDCGGTAVDTVLALPQPRRR
ncbi:MAG: hypothetical protein WD766_10425 [Gemmatimonadota bacterium]